MSEDKLDVVIIGGGPAGLSSAIYTARSDMDVLVLDEPDKLLDKVEKIENYFGFPEGISGKELLERGRKHGKRFGAEIKMEKALLINMDGEDYLVKTADNSYETRALIITPGIQHHRPSLDGIKEFEGKGVSYCVTCDAPLFKDQKVGLLGNKDLVAKEALELYEYTQDIKIYTNGRKLDIAESLDKKIKELDIPIVTKDIDGVKGEEKFEGLVFDDGEEAMSGLMIAEGTSGALDFAKSLGIQIDEDQIVVDKDQSTNLPRVYAAGDCTGGARQIGAAVGEGAAAAINLINELRGEEYYDWKH